MKVLGSVNVNGEEKQLGVEKDGDLYKYVLGNEVVGVFDPDIMADTLIIFRENTLENELSDQIRDEITQVIEAAGKEEILKAEPEKDQGENAYTRQMGYQKTIGEEEKNKNPEKAGAIQGKDEKREKTLGVKEEVVEIQQEIYK